MTFRLLLLKSRLIGPQLVLGVVVLALGSLFLFLRANPGFTSNLVAWLETEGAFQATFLGLILCLLGFWMLSASIKQLFSHQISYSKGELFYSVKSGLFEQIVQQLWSEYFDRPDLRAYVSVHGRHLAITGETPEGWNTIDELSAFLSYRLLSLTGYWGDLSLFTSPEAKKKDL